MKKPNARVLTLAGAAIALAFASGSATHAAADATASNVALGSTITATASGSQYAGAIFSLTFRNVQYTQNSMKGRSLQSSANYDGYAECLNPTEAGSNRDGNGPTSSSILQSISSSGIALQTSTQMAYYLQPGESVPADHCGNGATTGQNTTIVSNDVVSKTVTIGASGIPNLIGYDVTFNISGSHSQETLEAVADYMQPSFSVYLSYDPLSKTLSNLSVNSHAQLIGIPSIAAMTNGSSAMGIMSQQVSPGNLGDQYFSYSFESGNFSKLNCVFNKNNVPAGAQFQMSCPLSIGNVDEIMSAMNSYYGSQNTTIPIYRFTSNASHLYTTSYTEGASVGYKLDLTGWHDFPGNYNPNYVPEYRCYRKGSSDHFISSDSRCEGTTSEGIIGYVSPSPASGLVTLYRFRNPGAGQHLVTTNYTEGSSASGYVYEGVLGYVAP